MRIARLVVGFMLVLSVSCGGDDATDTTAPRSPSPETSAPDDTEKPKRKPRIVDGELEVVAIGAAFQRLPKVVSGPTVITLKNATEFGHELRIMKLSKGDDLSSISGMDRSEVLDRLEQLATTGTVDRGKTSKPLKLKLKPGHYGVVCLLGFPEDTHASRGMWQELTVVKDA